MTEQRSLLAEPGAVATARHFVESAIPDVPVEQRDAIVLMVSELATNCVVHAGGEFTISIDRGPDEIRVEVTDTWAGDPVAERAQHDEARGRGLFIVEQLSDTWGVTRRHGTKSVWFAIRLPRPDYTETAAAAT